MPDFEQIPREATGALHDLDEVQRHAAELRHLVGTFQRQRPPVLAAASKLALRPGDVVLTEEERRQAIAALERAQARRWVPRVRAAGEAVPNADAPAVTPDTVWSGDYDTLVSLFQVSLRRVTLEAAYAADLFGRCPGRGFRRLLPQRARGYGRTHVEP